MRPGPRALPYARNNPNKLTQPLQRPADLWHERRVESLRLFEDRVPGSARQAGVPHLAHDRPRHCAPRRIVAEALVRVENRVRVGARRLSFIRIELVVGAVVFDKLEVSAPVFTATATTARLICRESPAPLGLSKSCVRSATGA